MNNAVKMMVSERMDGRHDKSHEAEDHETHLPFEKFAKILMNGKPFIEYVKKHGYHFTPELADQVCKMMENADGSTHRWTTLQVRDAMMSNGMKENPLKATWGDATVAANMCYADYYPSPVTTEKGCLEYAYKQMRDPDGYEGMTFGRWLSDVVSLGIEVDWEQYT